MIYKRHYLKELFLVFTFVISACYFLYVLIDCSSNPKLFQSSSLHLWDILLYYFYQFSQHAEILIPIALLLSALKVILTANVQREILALLAAGLSLKKITRPFLLFALLIMSLCYLNYEFLQPTIYLKLAEFEKIHLDKQLPSDHGIVHPLTLEDHSLLIYNYFDPIQNQIHDLFWQKSTKDIYKIRQLDLTKRPPTGYQIDHLVRKNSKLTLVKHYDSLPFHAMILPKDLTSLFRPAKWQSLSGLAQLIPLHDLFNLNDKQASITTFFLYKLTMPLVVLLVVVAPLCYLMRYSRKVSPFLIYGLSLFFYITFFTMLKASVILGENQILHPLVAICVPMASLLLLFGYKYAKL